MKQEKLTLDDVINWWLNKFHNTNLDEVLKKHPDWATDSEQYTIIFYDTYQVTTEEYDMWDKWLTKALMKEFHLTKKGAERSKWMIVLNTAPTINDNIKVKRNIDSFLKEQNDKK